MDRVIANQTDETIAHTMKFYECDINRFIFYQFAMNLWKKQPNVKQSSNSAANFANKLFDNVDQNRMSQVYHKKYMNIISDDALIHILSFLCNQDKLIHTSLILLNKRFNTLIKNNYHSFNYEPNYHDWNIQCHTLVHTCRKMIDYRLNDGFWLSNVYIKDSPTIDQYKDGKGTPSTRFKWELYGMPKIQLKDQSDERNWENTVKYVHTFDNTHMCAQFRMSRLASHQSRTRRPVTVHNNYFTSRKNTNSMFLGSMCVDTKMNISPFLYMYEKGNKNNIVEQGTSVFASSTLESERPWVCAILDKRKEHAPNGQVCVLIDLRNDKTFAKMNDKEYYEMMENKKYHNVHPMKIRQQTNKNEYNKLNQQYMFEYWIHIDNNKEVIPFGSESSIQDQNKMVKLLYSMDICGIDSIKDNNQFTGINVIHSFDEFESLSYNGKYVSDRLNDAKNSCMNNNLIKIKDDKTVCHECFKDDCCLDVDENDLIKQRGFVSERPIIEFDLDTLFNTTLFYNEKHNHKLMVYIKPKYLLIKNQSRWIHLFNNKNSMEWRPAQLLLNSDTNNKHVGKNTIMERFKEWKGQCQVRIDITKEIMKELKLSIEEIGWLSTEMKEINTLKNSSQLKIFYDYFVHLDDESQVKPLCIITPSVLQNYFD